MNRRVGVRACVMIWAGWAVAAAVVFGGEVPQTGESATTRRPAAPSLVPPVIHGKWVVPDTRPDAAPIWGFRDGLRVGLWPTPGPRGLLRIYAPPALGLPERKMINFIAIEPIVGNTRSLSEIEPSASDQRPGKLFWTSLEMDDRSAAPSPRPPAQPRFRHEAGVECMSFFLHIEPFRNGAQPILEIVFRENHPEEVGLRVFSTKGGTPMDACALTATMGNYGRLRRLWLAGETVSAGELWPTFSGRDPTFAGFAEWRSWPAAKMLRRGDMLLAMAAGDEQDPAAAVYDSAVPRSWRYPGKPATQYWQTRAAEGVSVRVNGRTVYWGTTAPIPGGIAFENFELLAPFVSGQEFVFAVTPRPPDAVVAPRWE